MSDPRITISKSELIEALQPVKFVHHCVAGDGRTVNEIDLNPIISEKIDALFESQTYSAEPCPKCGPTSIVYALEICKQCAEIEK